MMGTVHVIKNELQKDQPADSFLILHNCFFKDLAESKKWK